jgi:hypothetical protein
MVEVLKRAELMEHGAYYVVGYHHQSSNQQDDDEEISFLSDPTGLNSTSSPSTIKSSSNRRKVNIPNPLSYIRRVAYKKRQQSSFSKRNKNKTEQTPLVAVQEGSNHTSDEDHLVEHRAPRQISYLTNQLSEDDEEFYLFERSPLSSNVAGEDDNKRRQGGESHWKKNQEQTSVPGATRGDDSPTINKEAAIQDDGVTESFTTVHLLIAFLAFLGVGLLCFHTLFEQRDWTVVDAAYFVVSTFTTVGQDALATTPSTPMAAASMLFTLFYALLGIFGLKVALGSIGFHWMEHCQSTNKRWSQFQILSLFESNNKTRRKFDPLSDRSTVRLGPILLWLTFLLGLASWVGKESGWDALHTVYYLVMTGKKNANARSFFGF